MFSMKSVSAATGAMMLIALAANAQEPSKPDAEQPGSMNQMSMGMMHECMQHCQAMSGSMQELRSAVEQARESGDPEQMRAALDQVHAHMSGMQEQMGGCMQMMQRSDHGRMDHGHEGKPDQE